MARYSRLQVYDAMLTTGLVPLFYHDQPEVAQEIVKAISAGGARLLEFTNRGEKALPVFSHLNAYIETNKLPIILGVGSIVDAPTAALYIANGANFIVGPLFNPEVARLCNRRKIAYLPGCATVAEISAAEEAGVEIVKIFPGETVGGPSFIKAVLGPLPWSRLMPTGGVEATRESVQSWLKVGACCVGLGSNLVRKDWVTAGNYAAMTETTQAILQWVAEVKK
jgi:2-dehydro-3-deoxyphosphogluconate aldolase / (4S)-4-hydroxy-2-oxoglutarate aldolase